MAIEPESSAERKKLADALDMLKRQDPTFRADESEETGQTLISGMGELHLEVIKHRLLRDFKLNVRVHKPRVSYRETVQKSVEVTGECHQQVAGQIAVCRGADPAGAVSTATSRRSVTASGGHDSAEQFLAAVLEVLTQQVEGGGSLGFPLMKVKITVLGGEIARNRIPTIWPFAGPRPTLFTRRWRRRASCCWSRS